MNNPIGATDPDGRLGKSVLQEAIEAQAPDDARRATQAVRVLASKDASSADKVNAGVVLGIIIATNVPSLPGAEKKAASTTATLERYAVGTADELYARSVVGDGLDIHHVPQSHAARQVISDYDAKTVRRSQYRMASIKSYRPSEVPMRVQRALCSLRTFAIFGVSQTQQIRVTICLTQQS